MRRTWCVAAFLLAAGLAGAAPAAVSTWFDAATARELSEARQEFDDAELKAIAEFDEAVGTRRAPIAMTAAEYRDQVASPALRAIPWTLAEQRRSEAATPIRLAAVDEAERRLQRRTLTALKTFFARERDSGRLSREAYARVSAGELAGGYFPSIRRRKWTGPAVTGFRQEVRSPAYRQVLGEVRKLWAAQAAGTPVVFAGRLPAW
jgi:hypothetical protein